MQSNKETVLFQYPVLLATYTYMPDAPTIFRSDVLSFYKEEIAGETVKFNHISILTQRQGVSKMTAFQQLAVGAAEQADKVLETHRKAHNAWQKFKAGF